MVILLQRSNQGAKAEVCLEGAPDGAPDPDASDED